MKIPSIVENMRIRYFDDGSFGIPRYNKNAIEFLNIHFIRVQGEQRWYPHTTGNKSLKNLKDTFKDKPCYIIGKGQSLNHLSEECFNFRDAPIIAINQAIHFVEKIDVKNPLFAMQQETTLRDHCRPNREDVYLIIPYILGGYYMSYVNKYIYNPQQFGLPLQMYTVISAIEVARYLGSSRLVMMCFDAYTHKNYEYANETKAWAGSVDPIERLDKQRGFIDKHLKNMNVSWVTPTEGSITEGHDLASDDTPLLLLDNLEEHRETDPSER